jgi:addiction module HigA family antidote
MLPTDRIPSHPGEILLEEFLRPLGTSQVQFSRELGIPLQRVNEIIRGKRGITAETALLLGARLGTTPEFWLNLQAAHELGRARTGISNVRLRALETRRGRRLESIAGTSGLRESSGTRKKK